MAVVVLVSIDVPQQPVIDALRRAAFLLRHDGFGQTDRETAKVIESMVVLDRESGKDINIGEASERFNEGQRGLFTRDPGSAS